MLSDNGCHSPQNFLEAIVVKQKTLDQVSDFSVSNKENLQKVPDFSTQESCETDTYKKKNSDFNKKNLSVKENSTQ